MRPLAVMLRLEALGLLSGCSGLTDLDDLINAGWLAHAEAIGRGRSEAHARTAARYAMRAERARAWGWQPRVGRVPFVPLIEARHVALDAPEPPTARYRTVTEERLQLVRGAISKLPARQKAAMLLWLHRAPAGVSISRRHKNQAWQVYALRKQAGRVPNNVLSALRVRAIANLRKRLVSRCAWAPCGKDFAHGWACRPARFCSHACACRWVAAHYRRGVTPRRRSA